MTHHINFISFSRFCLLSAIAFVALVTLASADSLQKAGPIKAAFSAEKVSNSTFVVHGPLASPTPENQGFMNNPAFIIGTDGIIVVDAGSTVQVGEMLVALIKKQSNLPVVATFSTHIHGDHWLGNQAISAAYPQVKHYAHPNLIEQANNGEGNAWVNLMLTLTEGASAGTVFQAPTLKVDEGQEIRIAGKVFKIHHDTLAHTDSDIIIELTDEKVLFMGDTVMNHRLGRLDDGSFSGLINFLDRALALKPLVVVPGHGQSGGHDIIENYKGIMQTVLETVATEYENGLSDFEIIPIIEQKLANKDHWLDFTTAFGKLVSLAYLEVEEASF